jgi:class 3 adenylate cyclase
MSPQRTSGVATVMFTDLEASTDTTTRLGDDAAAAFFAAHDRIVRGQLETHGGRRVKSTGDGFLAVFDSPRSAIACALAIQHDLAAQQDGPRVPSASTPARCARTRASFSAPRSVPRDYQPAPAV